MKALTNPIAIATFNRLANAAKQAPTPRPKYDSRSADKFVVRGSVELFKELAAIGAHQGRSMNSEAVAGILYALTGHVRSEGMLRVLKSYLGEEVANRVLSQIPDFDVAKCKSPAKSVFRFPPTVRDTIRDGVAKALGGTGKGTDFESPSMNSWMLEALVFWVNMQRKHYGLLSAALVLDQTLIESDQGKAKAG